MTAFSFYYSFPQLATNVFCKATIQALNTLGAISLVRGNSAPKRDPIPGGDVTSVVSFSGFREGFFSISLSRQFADMIFRETIEKEARDSYELKEEETGKFASKITEFARVQLQAQDYELFPATITTFHGKNGKIPWPNEGSSILTPFKTGDGNFYLETGF